MPTALAPLLFAAVPLPTDERMVYWLGKAARELREETGGTRSRVAGALRCDQGTVTRFEQGKGWPTKVGVDEMLNAYVSEFGLEHSLDLWERAATLWRLGEE